MTPTADERERIRAAMDRILAGTPQRCNGALTIVALAQEADVPATPLPSDTPTSKTSSTNASENAAVH